MTATGLPTGAPTSRQTDEQPAMSSEFNHFDSAGQAHMVDIGAKAVTARRAVATGLIRLQPATLERVAAGTAAKGDVLGVARIAAIQGAKRTADLIPLCHPIALTRVTVLFELIEPESQTGPGSAASGPAGEGAAIRCTATVECEGRTGVEMEALTAVQVGLLTIYDMCKAVDRGMVMDRIHLLEKHGGQSGNYRAA